ncbi:ferredoxin--NADP reductase [Alteromonadaceae bacterium M269]|nr:ferredoxin--NADP reductase [Alteromonadaceae bacterium M269]
MRNIISEEVTHVHHWNQNLFTFKCTRQQSLTFESGQFVMIGLEVDGKPLMRAYSIASASYEDELEFFSIKVENGALTSRLKDIRVGQNIMVSTKAAGTLVPGHLIPGKHLYLLSSGTGLAPFMSIIRDPHIYESYDKIILVHCVREVSELAYQQEIEHHLPDNEYFGDLVREKLLYYPTVTREHYQYNSLGVPDGLKAHQGRITTLLKGESFSTDLQLPKLDPEHDRFMLCGNNAMLQDIMTILNEKGFSKATSRSQGHYVIEQAFIEK